MSTKAVFIDRDGVLNRAFVRDGVPHPPQTVNELEILPGVPEAMERLRHLGYLLIVVTNQPDVARGTQSQSGVEAINELLRTLVIFDDLRCCYHDGGDNCNCRKPRPGMLLEAAEEKGIDLRRSFMVGDRWSDVAAGAAAGCRTILIEYDHSQSEKCSPDFVAMDLTEAAQIIADQTPRSPRPLSHEHR